jgi:hypothetical protein
LPTLALEGKNEQKHEKNFMTSAKLGSPTKKSDNNFNFRRLISTTKEQIGTSKVSVITSKNNFAN